MLEAGQRLGSGECLPSPGGQAELCMEADGDLVLYHKLLSPATASGGSKRVWRRRLSAGSELVLHEDGRLQALPPACSWCEGWAVFPPGHLASSATHLAVQDNCSLILVAEGKAVWEGGNTCVQIAKSTETVANSTEIDKGSIWLIAPLLLIFLFACLATFCLARRSCRPNKGNPGNLGQGRENQEEAYLNLQHSTVRKLLVIQNWAGCFWCGVMLMMMQGDNHWNSVPLVASYVSWILSNAATILSIWLPPRVQCCSMAAIMAVVARALRIVLFVFASIAVALSAPDAQRAFREHPVYAALGALPPSPCEVASTNYAAFIVQSLVPITVVLPVADGVVFSLFSVLAYSSVDFARQSQAGESGLVSPSELVSSVVIFAGALLVKRQLESTQWQLVVELSTQHSQVVRERVLRYQAEHTAEPLRQRAKPPLDTRAKSSHSVSDSQGGATALTTSTAMYFRDLLDQGRPVEDAMASLQERCAAEHRLIEPSTLTLVPDLLGRGGFGAVFKGTWHGAPIAIKVPSSASVKDSGHLLSGIVDELYVLRHVRHPNIVNLFGVCVTSIGVSLVLELVEGAPLTKFAQGSGCTKQGWSRGAPDDATKLSIIHGVGCALWYLHAYLPCVVHGDLKPGNVMVTGDARGRPCCAKLLDFGLSRLKMSSAKPLGGTIGWLAPEVLKWHQRSHTASDGENDEQPLPPVLAPSVDVFAYGLLIYFVLTGSRPPTATLDGPTQEPATWPWPQEGSATVAAHMALPMLAKVPTERPSVHEALEQLRWPPNHEVASEAPAVAPPADVASEARGGEGRSPQARTLGLCSL